MVNSIEDIKKFISDTSFKKISWLRFQVDVAHPKPIQSECISCLGFS